MKKIYGLLFYIIILLNPSISFSQNTRIDSLESRVNILEKVQNDLKEQYQIDFKNQNLMINEKLFQERLNLNILGYVGFPTTLIAILTLAISGRKYVKKTIEKRIESIIEQKREEIIKLIEGQELETRLRTNKKLLVLSPNEDSQKTIQKFFQELHFGKVRYRIMHQYKAFDDFDLIIFNNSDGKLEQELINKYIENSDENTNFIAFTSKTLNRHPKLNFSNSQFTLYHNILLALKYGELIKNSA